MPRPLAPTFRAFAIAVLAALPFALVGACTVENGVTPTCVPDIDSNGIKTGVENGCTGFAICRDSAGNNADPATCCKAADGTPYAGSELSSCLLAYGVGAPTTAASTTSSGTGSGGAGGGN
jgi:hypothetical protein